MCRAALCRWSAIAAVMSLAAGCAGIRAGQPETAFQEVNFVTTRADTGSADPEKRYGDARGATAFGAAMVAVDPARSLSPFAAVQPARTLRQTERLRRGPLQQVLPLAEEAFVAAVAPPSGPAGAAPEALVFIHGYKRTFSEAVVNAALLRHQLAFPGPVIAFAWPSANRVLGYLEDRENVEWSATELRRLVGLLGRSIPGVRVHLVAHSLGNRALVGALTALVAEHPEFRDWPIGEIVMLAPDLDRDLFIRETAPLLQGMPSRITLYVSAEDIPLMASASVHKYPRLGDAREGVPIIPGIETVDVTDSITIFDGHGYYESDPATIEDLYHLIREGRGADQRPGLVPVDTEAGRHWRLLPRP